MRWIMATVMEVMEAKKEVGKFLNFLKQKKLDNVASKGEAVLRQKGPKEAIVATIEAFQCCDEFQRWTPLDVRMDIRAEFYPLARAFSIPQSDYILIV